MFDATQFTRDRSDTCFATPSLKKARETLLQDSVTHNDCVLRAILVKRPANSLDIAGSVECSAPTNHDRFLTVCYDVRSGNSVGPTHWGTIGFLTRVRLLHADIFLFHNTCCLFQGMEFESEAVDPEWTIRETLHEQRNQHFLVRRIFCNATRKMTYELNV